MTIPLLLRISNRLYLYCSRAFRYESRFRRASLGTLSVIVPVYNDEKFLDKCLASLQGQFYRNFECLIVDDASTDRSAEIAQRYVKKDSRFIYVKHDRNQGLSAARNTGLRKATGDYITFLDSDDWVFRYGILERLLKFQHNDRPWIAGVYAQIAPVAETPTTKEVFLHSIALSEKIEDRDFISTGGDCPFNVHAPILKTKAVREVGFFDETLKAGCEDWDFWYRMMRLGYSFVGIPYTCAAYRQKRKNMRSGQAFGHLSQAVSLLLRAHQSEQVTPAQIQAHPGTWVFFEKSCDEHKLDLIIARRSLNYMAMAYVHGNLEDALRIGKLFSPSQKILIKRFELLEQISRYAAMLMKLDQSAQRELHQWLARETIALT